jgi:hypothetical protein
LVQFEEEGENGDICWTTPCRGPANEGENDYRLATRFAKNDREVSVVQSLLMPLEDFPVVNAAIIFDLTGLTRECRLARIDPSQASGAGHWYSLWDNWVDWLSGKRRVSWRKQFRCKIEELSDHMERCVYGSERCFSCIPDDLDRSEDGGSLSDFSHARYQTINRRVDLVTMFVI